MAIDRNVTGSYQLACESSPNKIQIDTWLNEGKQIKWISEQLKEMGDYISPNSISKYKKYREELIEKELQNSPEYVAVMGQVNQELQDSISKIRKVDMIGELADIIDHSAELLANARYEDIKINSIKDMRMIQQTMLEAISAYGETMLNAQKYAAIEDDPSLLQSKNTTININVKDTLTEILKNAINEDGGGFDFIDKLRKGVDR